jgi:hypothetical protein
MAAADREPNDKRHGQKGLADGAGLIRAYDIGQGGRGIVREKRKQVEGREDSHRLGRILIGNDDRLLD